MFECEKYTELTFGCGDRSKNKSEVGDRVMNKQY